AGNLFDVLIGDELASIQQAGVDIGDLHPLEVGQNFLARTACCEHSEHMFDRHPPTANNRLAPINAGVEGDSLQEFSFGRHRNAPSACNRYGIIWRLRKGRHPRLSTSYRGGVGCEPANAACNLASTASSVTRTGVASGALNSRQKWQAAARPLASATSAGISARQRSRTCGQRVWKRQPGGGAIGLGTSPSRMMRFRRAAGSGTGTAESSA